jgi:transcriptional antiterminator
MVNNIPSIKEVFLLNSLLLERVDLLLDSEQIEREVYDLIPSILKKVEDELQVQLTDENAGPFITHLAIALQRIKKNEVIEESSSEIKLLTEKYQNLFELAKEILSDITPKLVDINAEASYITLYFCLLTGKKYEQ